MFWRKRPSSDFSAEIEAHLQQEAERLREHGLPEKEAQATARRAFGNVLQTEERFYETRRWLWFDHFSQDLRFALRTLARNRGFAIVAILTLTLGISINATMFSMVSAFLLRPTPGYQPDRVVVVSAVNPGPRFHPDSNPMSAPNYFVLRDKNDVFSGVAAADAYRTVSLSVDKHAETISSSAVSLNYFSVLGVAPGIGRTFEAGEDQPGRDHVVILTHDLWVRNFGSDPSVLSRTIRINRENYDIVGVMPSTVRLLGFTNELWTPLVLNSADQTATARNQRSLYVFGRLKDGVSLDQARAEAVTFAQRAQSDYPDLEKGWGAAVRTLPNFLIYDFGITTGLAVIMTTVGFVLLIACANVAGLLLARATGRRKELAMRISLGAGRARIVRQLLTEGFVIAILGGFFGLVLTYWGVKFVRANMAFNDAISAVGFRVDSNVLLFVMAVSLLCAVLCALAPALNAARTDINSSLKSESRTASAGCSQTRLRSIMVGGEIAVSLFLLVGTGLLIRGLYHIEHQKLGFQPAPLLTASVALDDARYKNATAQIAFSKEILSRMQQIPGALSAAAVSDLPATGAGTVTLRIKDQPELPAAERLLTADFVITPEFFTAAAIPLERGRAFTAADNSASPRVAIVNRLFVHDILHDADPLGKQIALDLPGVPLQWAQIIGVSGTVKSYSEDTREEPAVYESFFQRAISSFSLLIRSGENPGALASALRNAVAQVDAELPLSHVETMPSIIDRQKGGDTLFSRLLGIFALLALILAAVGIYGLVAQSVGQRTHEIGIRLALGAKKADVLRMILWQGSKIALIGTAIGFAISLPLPKIFDAIFRGLHVSEPLLYLIIPAALVAVTLAATYIPARRALSVDPMMTLRHE